MHTTSRNVLLRPVVEADLPFLFRVFGDPSRSHLWMRSRLRLFESGARYEAVVEQRLRVERARSWRDLAQQNLEHTQQALAEELAALDKQGDQCRAEMDAAQDAHNRSRTLRASRATSEEDYREVEKRPR